MNIDPTSLDQARLRRVNPVTGDGAVEFLATTQPNTVNKLYSLGSSEVAAGTVARIFPDHLTADVVESEQAERWIRIQEAQERLSKVPGRIIHATGMLAVAGSTYLGLDKFLLGEAPEIMSSNTENIAMTTLVIGTTAVSSALYVISGASGNVKSLIAQRRARTIVSKKSN